MDASRIGAGWTRLRRAVPAVDHLSKAFARYFGDSCDRLAAGITYYGFLCLFPLLLLVGAVVGLVVRGDAERQRRLLGHLADFIPDTLADRLVQLVTERAGTTGVLGILGLVIAGLGWVDTLRESIRAVWHQAPHAGNIATKKAKDVLILLGLGATVLASIAVSGVATALTRQGLALLALPDDDALATVLMRLVALALALVSNTALLLYLLVWLPRTAEPVQRVLRGALAGAVLLELAKYVGFYYFAVLIGAGADLYGASLAAAVGLLLWLNLTARLVMFTAAWTVTAPYRPDVRPSGTATPTRDGQEPTPP